jgi:hypothetical protein
MIVEALLPITLALTVVGGPVTDGDSSAGAVNTAAHDYHDVVPGFQVLAHDYHDRERTTAAAASDAV